MNTQNLELDSDFEKFITDLISFVLNSTSEYRFIPKEHSDYILNSIKELKIWKKEKIMRVLILSFINEWDKNYKKAENFFIKLWEKEFWKWEQEILELKQEILELKQEVIPWELINNPDLEWCIKQTKVISSDNIIYPSSNSKYDIKFLYLLLKLKSIVLQMDMGTNHEIYDILNISK